MPSASAARAGIACLTAEDDATSACVVIAPMTIASPSFLMPFSSPMPERSTTVPGLASRNFIAPTRLCPPASALPPLLLNAAAASATDFARWYSNAYMINVLSGSYPFALTPGLALLPRGLHCIPDSMRRRRHVHVFDARRSQSIVDRVHQR